MTNTKNFTNIFILIYSIVIFSYCTQNQTNNKDDSHNNTQVQNNVYQEDEEFLPVDFNFFFNTIKDKKISINCYLNNNEYLIDTITGNFFNLESQDYIVYDIPINAEKAIYIWNNNKVIFYYAIQKNKKIIIYTAENEINKSISKYREVKRINILYE